MNEVEPVEDFSHHADTAEKELLTAYQFKNDDAHLDPSRWWFASSAFPMIAGTLGPVASAFSICALVRPWRQYISPGGDIQKASFELDPPWLTIVNAIQLAMAIVSNVFLLLNMTRRVRFTIAQPITIVGWYISAICLVTLNATAAGPLKEGLHPANEYVWSQAFYYGIYAAILYFVDASLMVVTFWGASAGHYDKDFVLTPSQRTLMLQTIMLLMYLLVGALVFSTIEGWNYLDAVYWADVTLFTVGFGDLAASTTLGRALLFPYALIGVISLGLVISSIRSMIIERGKRRLDARMEEKNRRRTVKTITRNGNDDILNPVHEVSDASSGSRQDQNPPAELKRRKAEFGLMRSIQKQASSRRRWMAMAISTGSWLLLWLAGAAIFLQCEKKYQSWTYFDAFYFCFVSLTTIGYGDRTPISNAGKSFFVFWSLLALPTMTVLISNAGDTVVKFVRDSTIRLGTITILPGDTGFTGNMKHIIYHLTCGQFFPTTVCQTHDLELANDSSEKVTGVFKALHPKNLDLSGCSRLNMASLSHDNHYATERRADGTSWPADQITVLYLHTALEEIPSGIDFHLLLVSEIQNVTRHLKASKPRRYTYEEWAWFLRLLGEDERDPGRHRKVRIKPKGKKGSAMQVLNDNEQLKWSWVGTHSPLMGSQEESEWILERLTAKLKESLTADKVFQQRVTSRGPCHGMISIEGSCKRDKEA
ncbi:Outward-rectifier potassium channel TOK1-like protein [Cladobotryum mycophilum]|uniref:Outward-rectifier potassium channel TOK1-like protein n=1 Tax=Cladobotryum mycophilum TaxID=491253 RepID=A0ABR0S7H5_9HYPO